MGCSHLGTSTSFKHFGLSFLFCLKFKIFLYFKIHCMHSHILAERLHFGSGGESIDQMTWTDWSNDVNRLNISTNSLNIFDSHVFLSKRELQGLKILRRKDPELYLYCYPVKRARCENSDVSPTKMHPEDCKLSQPDSVVCWTLLDARSQNAFLLTRLSVVTNFLIFVYIHILCSSLLFNTFFLI